MPWRAVPTIMRSNNQIALLFALFMGLCPLWVSADNGGLVPADNAGRFVENKGQWDARVQHKLKLNFGSVFLEKDAFTFSLLDTDVLEELLGHADDGQHQHHVASGQTIPGHAFRIKFNGTSPNVEVSGADKFQHYENYFLGNDPNKWAKDVRSFARVNYHDLYSGIDLSIYGSGNALKYDFTVAPGADPNEIALEFEGVDKLYLKDGELHYETSVSHVYEQAPIAFQTINGEKIAVACHFTLKKNKVGFDLPNGYNSNYPLVIDPTVIFASYTGSTTDNWGYTATYDADGNAYVGGVVFRGLGYPTFPGSFQTTFGGPGGPYDCDIGLSKFTADGTALLFSTYLGGDGNEYPSSTVVNNNDELVVYGATGSSNFPMSTTTLGAYTSFSGGNQVLVTNVINFTTGSDIYVAKFNAAGNALLGSTYIGGTGNDGMNVDDSVLLYNYADHARGEVITDDQGFVYIGSSTQSSNLPVTTGSIQQNLRGYQDGCVFKLSPNLDQVVWGTYYGGSNNDATYSLKLDTSNNVYIAGGTTSNDLIGMNGLHTANNGGVTDGYVAHFNFDGDQVLNGTYVGTNQYDQVYLMYIDINQDVYIVGQTLGNYPVTPSTVYNNPGSTQFIHKLSTDLSTTEFSTVYGSGGPQLNLALTAMLVDVCDNIYVAGWGGQVNSNFAPGNRFTIGNTLNMPITPDAQQPTTDGSDFYFIILSKDADSLVYGSYYGGVGPNGEHVDGGTSRFDDNGVIYQAVCASCAGTNIFPTTAGSWAPVSGQNIPGGNCNLGIIKLAFELAILDVEVTAAPATTGCVPLTVQLDPNGINAQGYYWDLGNGNISRLEKPIVTYTDTGVYNVMVIGFDSTTCSGRVLIDTAYVQIVVTDDSLSAGFTPTIINDCDSFSVQFNNNTINLSNGPTFHYWEFGDGNISSDPNPLHTYQNAGTYTIKYRAGSQETCNPLDSATTTITFLPRQDVDFNISDTLLCIPALVDFTNLSSPTSAQNYIWNFGDGSPTITVNSPQHNYTTTGTFQVTLTSSASGYCNPVVIDSATIIATDDTINADFNYLTISDCDSFSLAFNNASFGATNYLWSFGDGTTSTQINPSHTYTNAGTYQVKLVAESTGACDVADSLTLPVTFTPRQDVSFTVDNNSGCLPLTVSFTDQSIGGPGRTYLWTFGDGGPSSTSDTTVTHTYTTVGTFTAVLTVTDTGACNVIDSDTVTITTSNDSTTAAFTYTIVKDDCDELTVEFTDQSTNSTSVFWEFGDSTTSTERNPLHTYTTADTFQVVMTVNAPATCNVTDTARATFIKLPAVEALPVVNSGCVPYQVDLQNNSSNATSYQWQLDNAFLSTDTLPVIELPNSGNYQLTLTAYNPNTCNDSSTASVSFSVHELPTAYFETDTNSYPIYTDVQFDNQSSSPARYLWEFGDGEISNEVDPAHFYTAEGTYGPCVNVTDSNSCEAVYCKDIELTFLGIIDVPNAFSPNNDQMNDILYVRGFGVEEMLFRVYNRWGELVFESTSLDHGWDGRYKGKDQEMEVYVWTLEATFRDGNKTGIRKGNVSLLR